MSDTELMQHFNSADRGGNRERGTVKVFVAEKGFGFLARDNGPDEFFHMSDMQKAGIDFVAIGDRLEFERGVNTRTGRSKAVNLRIIDDAA